MGFDFFRFLVFVVLIIQCFAFLRIEERVTVDPIEPVGSSQDSISVRVPQDLSTFFIVIEQHIVEGGSIVAALTCKMF